MYLNLYVVNVAVPPQFYMQLWVYQLFTEDWWLCYIWGYRIQIFLIQSGGMREGSLLVCTDFAGIQGKAKLLSADFPALSFW